MLRRRFGCWPSRWAFIVWILTWIIGKVHGQTLGDALNAPDWAWATGGDTNWLVETSVTHDGIVAASSGNLRISQTNWIQTTVTGPVAVTFWAKASICADTYARLDLLIGGVPQTTISGNLDWQQRSFYVPPGSQTVEWLFTLNCTSAGLQNMVWLDQVSVSSPVPPVIVVQPTNETVLAGDRLALVVGATGTEPFAFQWFQNGALLAGSTNSSLSLVDVQAGTTGDYLVVVSSQFGSVTSQVATVTVVPSAPVFTTQPASQGCPIGGSVLFQAAAKGSEPFSGQWYSNGIAVTGATSASLSLTNVQLSSFCDYWQVMTNGYGNTTSALATLSWSPVIAWGANDSGETVIPPTATNVIALAGGDNQCLALRADGSVIGWGGNFVGQAAPPSAATNVVSIGAGSTHSLAARRDGAALLWGMIIGSTVTNVPEDLTNAAAVALGPGAQHALALRTDGTVLDWGGWGNYLPLLTNIPNGATDIVSVAAGAFHDLALRADGTVVAWGDNTWGQTNVPESASNVVGISCGWYHNLALRADGKLVTWGSDPFSGGSGAIPLPATNIVAFACGGNHSLGLRADGKLFAWGAGYQGQTAIPAWATNIVAVAGTSSDSLALVGNGPPLMSTPMLNRSVLAGGKAYIRATAVGVWPLSYTWQFNGATLPAATNALLVISNAQPNQMGYYSVVVSNALGTVTSSNVWLTVISNQALIVSGSLRVGNNVVSFRALSPAGLKWAVVGSSNFIDWLNLGVLTNTTGTMLFSAPATNGDQYFYRLHLVP